MIKVINYFLGIFIAVAAGTLKYEALKNRQKMARWRLANSMSFAVVVFCLYLWLLIFLDYVGLYPD